MLRPLPLVCLIATTMAIAPLATKPADAQRTFRDKFKPYNLVCLLDGDLGTQRLMFHVEDVTFALLYLPIITLSGKELDVQVFDSSEVRAAIKDGLPGQEGVARGEFVIDRNTGAISATYRGAQSVTSTGVGWHRIWSAKGRCEKQDPAF